MGRKSRKSEGRRRGRERLLKLDFVRLEVARGDDGPLRGRPEPALLLAVYRVGGDRVTLIDRALHRVRSRGPDPERIELDLPTWEVTIPRVDDMRTLVLGVALEVDSGRGVARVYADLESPDRLCAWPTDAHDPTPVTLAELARMPAPRPPASVPLHLVDDERDLRDAELGDDWVGAAAFHFDDGAHAEAQRRVRFVSADGRNDWTLVLATRLV